MKRIAIFVLVFVMAAGFAIADNIGFSTAPEGSGSYDSSDYGSSGGAKGTGISVGAEAGWIKFQDLGDGFTHLYIMPTLSYDGYLGEALALNAGLGVPFGIEPDFWLGVDFDLMLTYNFGNLSISAENALAIPMIPYEWERPYYGWDKDFYTYSPMFGPLNVAKDNMYPGIKYNLFSGIGTFYFKAVFPVRIIPDPFSNIGMNFSLGLNGKNGFRFWISETNSLIPKPNFFRALNLFASYNAGSFYGELYVVIPTYEGGMDSTGVEITPKVEFRYANGFRFYVELPLWGIGSQGDTYFGLTVGAKMSF